MAETHTPTPPYQRQPDAKTAEAGPYVLEAVNNARAAIGKSALSKLDCDAAIAARPKPVQAKVDPESKEPPPFVFVESDAQFLVALPTNYVGPTLDEGRMKTTPPTPPRSNV